MTCANVLVGLGKDREGMETAMLDGRMGMQLSASLREGSDVTLRRLPVLRSVFQSTLPRRERQQFLPKILSDSQQKLFKTFKIIKHFDFTEHI